MGRGWDGSPNRNPTPNPLVPRQPQTYRHEVIRNEVAFTPSNVTQSSTKYRSRIRNPSSFSLSLTSASCLSRNPPATTIPPHPQASGELRRQLRHHLSADIRQRQVELPCRRQAVRQRPPSQTHPVRYPVRPERPARHRYRRRVHVQRRRPVRTQLYRRYCKHPRPRPYVQHPHSRTRKSFHLLQRHLRSWMMPRPRTPTRDQSPGQSPPSRASYGIHGGLMTIRRPTLSSVNWSFHASCQFVSAISLT